MASIDDWAAKAARRVCEEALLKEDQSLEEPRVAAIIATFATPLMDLLRESRREHWHDEFDAWQCCPQCPCLSWGPCDCGAAAWNARVDTALEGRKP